MKEPGIGIVANENTKTSPTKGSTAGNMRYSNNLSEDRKMKKMVDDLKRERELVGGEDPEWEVWGCNYPPEGWRLSLPASKKRKVGDDKLPSSSSSSTTASPKNGAKEESLKKIMPLTKAALRVSGSG